MKRGWGMMQRGFTIIEIMVVVVVISIIATIVVGSYIVVVDNAQNTTVKTDLSNIADQAKLAALDRGGIAVPGGATETGSGNPAILNAVGRVSVDRSAFDTTINNVYYCAGQIGGLSQFSLIARSLPGATFVYNSESGLDDSPDIDLADITPGVAVCEAVGYSDSFTWSVGYNASTSTWQTWLQ